VLLEELEGKTELPSVDQVVQKLDLLGNTIVFVSPHEPIEFSVHKGKVSLLGCPVGWDRVINLEITNYLRDKGLPQIHM